LINDVIVEKVINIYQNRCNQTQYGVCLVSFQILSTECVGSRRELVANCVHTTDADATKQFRRVGVGGVYWALDHGPRPQTLTLPEHEARNEK